MLYTSRFCRLSSFRTRAVLALETHRGKPQSGFVASRDVRNLPVILIYYHTSPNGRSYASWKVSSNLEKERLAEILG